MTDANPVEERVLMLAPTIKDAALSRSILERAGIACHCCADLAQICHELQAGAGAVLLAEEAIGADRTRQLDEWLSRQAAWSDLPILILARPGAESAGVKHSMEFLGNVTVLERPTRVAALVSAVRTALRARRWQYDARAHLSQIERSEQKLRDSDKRKDEFLAVLAHELRNPLAPIRNSLHILRMTAQADPAAQRVCEMMQRQVNHMVRLVDDLMEVSRITRGKIELRKESVEVATVIRSAVEASRPLIDAAAHKLVLVIPAEPLILEGDPIRLAQVFSNLLNNAAKYTEPGGQICLTVRREDDDVAISVRDTGRGIPNELLPRVFEMFMQIDGHANPHGLGIGLALVKTLVEMHDGNVEAHSEGVGRGSEFVVRLPLARTWPPADVPGTQVGSPPDVALRVLVADDNNDAADSLGMLLELIGADVHVVYSGTDALTAFATYRPAVVLLDIGMPGMDGYEVARRIRSLPRSEDVTLIALTGWGQEEDRQRSKSAGFDHHITKPPEFNALKTILLR
jgi:signal transduction histidine kinase